MEYNIPTYNVNDDSWSYTFFATKEEWLAFLWTLWKEPGKYEFDETSLKFNEQGKLWRENDKVYCEHPYNSADFINYWDTEKEKCITGVLYVGKHTWYVPRDYYMWLNFMPLYNKEVKKFTFPDVRDAQYHIALYEQLAELSQKHCAILKKRQIASSYFHMGKLINRYYFDEGSICKIAASLKDYINEKGVWRFLEEQRNFLNEHTAWYRPNAPNKIFNWEQKIEVNEGGRKTFVGNKSIISGHVLDKDPTNGVGGPCSIFYHEEGGIAPKADITTEYLLPALEDGIGYTGMFILAGSVGDLKQCQPLKDMIMTPESRDVLAVHTNLVDDKGGEGMCGLFIPEQWSMKPCIDEYGNSQVDKAMQMISERRARDKKKLAPNLYQIRISQKPINIKEAFDYRTEAEFPAHLVAAQRRRIEEGEYPVEYVDLTRNENNKIEFKPSKRRPITDFPIKPTEIHKDGVVCMYERPKDNLPFMTYLASIDPVNAGKTTTSKSLFSIIIYKCRHEIIKHMADETIENHIEEGKIVATWCGRFDDIDKTNERGSMLLELYNAWTIVENNVTQFITHMIKFKRQKYLVPKHQISFLKEMQANKSVFQDYGWRNVSTIFKANMVPYGIQFCEEELSQETNTEGDILKIRFGIERIPDIMILKEMTEYRDGVNVDRLISFCALASFISVTESNLGYKKVIEKEEEKLVKSEKITTLSRNPYKNIGQNRNGVSRSNNSKRAFKNLR